MTSNPILAGEHHTIRPYTEILNGVFPGYDHSIVVDFAENPAPYELAYEMLEGSLPVGEEHSPMEIAKGTHEVVLRKLPYDEEALGVILRREADARGLTRMRPEDAIGLSKFLEREDPGPAGICHHRTLFAGALIRLLQQRQPDTGGRVSVELIAPEVKSNAAHTWIRYTRAGERIVLDSSTDSFPPVFRLASDPLRDNRLYLRPEELREFIDEEDLEAPDKLRIKRYERGQ